MLCYVATSCQPVKTRTPKHDRDRYQYRTPSADGTGKFYLGREIAQVMDASGSDWLERSSRPKEENTEKVIAGMQLTPGLTVADIGAGTGYYTFRIAPLLTQGKIYAVEIQDELINMLHDKKDRQRYNNVEVIRGDTANINLPESILDVVFMVDVYHELSWPEETLQSIRKSLKKNGKLILVEYRGEDPAVRIKPLHKTTVNQLTRELKANGFELERRMDDLPIQHLLVFRVSPE